MTILGKTNLAEGVKGHSLGVDVVLVDFVSQDKEAFVVRELEHVSNVFVRLNLTRWVARVDDANGFWLHV